MPTGGEGVTAPAIGTRVLFMSYFGGMSDVVVVPTAQVAKIPDAMTFEEGAAIPVNYVTAMQMLFSIARVGYSILREGGLLVCFGMANVASPGKANWWKAATTFYGRPKFDPFDMMGQNRGVAGLNLGHMWHLQAMIQKSLTDCVTMYEQGKIKPHLDGVFSFDKAADAFGRIENGKNIGKVVLVPTLG